MDERSRLPIRALPPHLLPLLNGYLAFPAAQSIVPRSNTTQSRQRSGQPLLYAQYSRYVMANNMTGKTATPRGRRKKNATDDGSVALSKETIVSAALEYIDSNGLEKFSLRNLATTLGVFPTALYWYVSSREQLLADVEALVLRNLVPEQKNQTWQAYLRSVLINCRNAIALHPNVAPLLGAQMSPNTGADLKLVEGIIGALKGAGFNGAALMGAYNTFLAALVGFTTQEFAPLPENASAWQGQMQNRLKEVDQELYPLVSQNLPEFCNRSFILRWLNGVDAPLDEGFAFYVDTIISGLEAMAARQAKP